MPRCKICDSYSPDRITIKHPLLHQMLNGLVDSDQLVCNKCLKAYVYQTIRNKLLLSQTSNPTSGDPSGKEKA